MDHGRILLVQEAKPDLRGKWNLPGGHIEHGEAIVAAASRELSEETQLAIPLAGLLGIYRGNKWVRFVFMADGTNTLPKAGDEILAVRWVELDAIAHGREEELWSPIQLQQIAQDIRDQTVFPLSMFRGTCY